MYMSNTFLFVFLFSQYLTRYVFIRPEFLSLISYRTNLICSLALQSQTVNGDIFLVNLVTVHISKRPYLLHLHTLISFLFNTFCHTKNIFYLKQYCLGGYPKASIKGYICNFRLLKQVLLIELNLKLPFSNDINNLTKKQQNMVFVEKRPENFGFNIFFFSKHVSPLLFFIF